MNVKKIKIKYALLPIRFRNFGNLSYMNNIALSKKQYNIVFWTNMNYLWSD